MLVQDRDTSRRVFVDTWVKYHRGDQITALEQLVLSVVLQHPEYHHLLEQPDILQHDFSSTGDAQNPFLHMGMHIAISEQISTDRPAGSVACYQTLLDKHKDAHKLQHSMMECLGKVLWQAQLSRTMPDEAAYLECLRKLA
jgi:hypothetical protein